MTSNDAPVWRTSSFTNNGTCVAVADLGDNAVGMRNSNAPDAGTLQLSRSTMADLLDQVRAGELDHLA